MKTAPHIALRSLPRRLFLRSTGAALALPLLECMNPVFAKAGQPPRRMLMIANNLGVLPKHFFPQGAGREYTLTPNQCTAFAPNRLAAQKAPLGDPINMG